jgi:small subunit ribosomal protein S27Ae
MGKKEKKTKKKGKRERKGRKHEGVKIWEKYEIQGDNVTRKNNHCPRCGPGVLLSKHKGSNYCGKCGYTDFKGSRTEVKEDKPDQKEKTE